MLPDLLHRERILGALVRDMNLLVKPDVVGEELDALTRLELERADHVTDRVLLVGAQLVDDEHDAHRTLEGLRQMVVDAESDELV